MIDVADELLKRMKELLKASSGSRSDWEQVEIIAEMLKNLYKLNVMTKV